MSDAAKFAAELDAEGAAVLAEPLAQRRLIASELLQRLVLRTPVGQPSTWKHPAPKGYVGGYHRGQWQMTNGAPAEGEVPFRSAGAVFSEAQGALEQMTLEATTWITNNGPAISRLARGWSPQAEDGWIEAEVERVRARHG